MSCLALALVALYIFLGAFWWRRIVLPGPVTGEPEDWRLGLALAARRGDIALLMAKGTFVLLWPLALGWGWVSARIT